MVAAQRNARRRLAPAGVGIALRPRLTLRTLLHGNDADPTIERPVRYAVSVQWIAVASRHCLLLRAGVEQQGERSEQPSNLCQFLHLGPSFLDASIAAMATAVKLVMRSWF